MFCAWRRHAGPWALASLAAGGVVSVTACGGDAVHAPVARSSVVWRITPNYGAVTMAVGDSVQLHVTSRGATGDELPLPGTVQWSSTNEFVVTVDATGKIRAHGEATSVQITATVRDTVLHQTLTSTTVVNVTTTENPLTSFVFESPDPPPPPDPFDPFAPPFPFLAKNEMLGLGDQRVLAVRALAGSDTIPVSFAVSSSDVRRATIQPWNGTPTLFVQDTGDVMLYARAYAYGTEYLDSARVRVGLTDSVSMTFISRVDLLMIYNGRTGMPTLIPALEHQYFFLPTRIAIPLNGLVTFVNSKMSLGGQEDLGRPTAEIRFENLANISPAAHVTAPPIRIRNFGSFIFYPDGPPPVRRFTAPGTYRWTSPTNGQSGTITVVP